MERLTQKQGNEFMVKSEHITAVTNGYTGEAVARLATFETFYENLLADQDKFAAELEQLRNAGKKNSVKFKEILGKKMMGSNTLVTLQAYGLH